MPTDGWHIVCRGSSMLRSQELAPIAFQGCLPRLIYLRANRCLTNAFQHLEVASPPNLAVPSESGAELFLGPDLSKRTPEQHMCPNSNECGTSHGTPFYNLPSDFRCTWTRLPNPASAPQSPLQGFLPPIICAYLGWRLPILPFQPGLISTVDQHKHPELGPFLSDRQTQTSPPKHQAHN